MIRNVVDIVVKRNVIIHIQWKTSDISPHPIKTKSAICQTITKISVQPDRPLNGAQRIFYIYDGKLRQK
jgi:hypothetical protein